MTYDPARYNRQSLRLRRYDYTGPGPYFVTICTHRRQCLFGQVVDGMMHANAYGDIVIACWQALPAHFPYAILDAFVVMPNHIHGIIDIVPMDTVDVGNVGNVGNVGATHASPPPSLASPPGLASPQLSQPLQPRGPEPHSLGAMIGSFKSAVTKYIDRMRKTPGAAVWQRNYYEHIIRNQQALHRIRRYILQNPQRWHHDRYG